jgi:hypothetical protein
MKSFRLFGLIALATATLHSQPTNGPVYWSTSPPDCSSLADQAPVRITNSSGATIGYSCYVSGTFVWLAAGGGWSTSIRAAAPASAPIGVDYTFYDTTGNNLRLDTTYGTSSSITSGDAVSFALRANQPSEVGMRGATSNAPNYGSTATGSVYAVFYCPNATTCADVLPQLLYSALPGTPWSLSVPIAWDTQVWTQWSAVGIDDGATRRVSLVVCNEDTTAKIFTVRVYDSNGTLAGTGTTPSIPPLRPLNDGSLGQGGTFGALLSDVISTPLPSGVFKILVDGGSNFSAVEMLQVNGASATTLQVAFDGTSSSSSPGTASARRLNIRSARVASVAKPVFSALE